MKTLTVSPKRQIAIPKDVCEKLHIKEGDQLILQVEEGRLIIEPSINVPRSQAWFWTEKIQEKVRKAEGNFRAGKGKKYPIDTFLKELEKRD